LFQSISSRTAGFAAFAQFDQLLPATEATIMALMFIGSAPASMGGGITTGTFAVLLIALWNYAQGRSVAVVGDRTIPAALVRKALAVLLVSLTVVMVATWTILYSHPVTLDMALFEVVSAFATCGLSLAFTSELDLTGQIAIVIVMLWGRLGALTIVATLAYVRPEPRASYPEEQILIG
jgi:trk system potassium uptake protein TrkH